MTEKLYDEAIKECLDNAEQYYKDANLLIHNGSYGHALALAVLGEEECAKAFVYRLYSSGVVSIQLIRRVERASRSHKRKHIIATLFAFIFKMTEAFENAEDKRWKQVPKDPEKRRKIILEDLKRNWSEIFKDALKDLERYATLQEWKLKGLYVDTEKGVLSSPKAFRKDEVVEYLSDAQKRLKISRKGLQKPLESSEIAELREAMKSSRFEEALEDACKRQ